jgi:hypothetical protein
MRKGKDPDPDPDPYILTNGSRSGWFKNIRIRIPNTVSDPELFVRSFPEPE